MPTDSEEPTKRVAAAAAECSQAKGERLRLAEDVRQLVDSLQVAFYRVDERERLVVMSHSGVAMLGYEREEELLDRPTGAYWLHPEQREAFRTELLQHGGATDWETDLVRRDGTVVSVAVTVRTIRDEHGRTMGYQGILRDITQWKAAEDAQRRSEKTFAQVFLTAPDSITISRLVDGTFVDVNPGFEKVTGWSRAEAVNRTALELGLWTGPEQREQIVRELQERGEVLHMQCLFRRRDGVLREADCSAGLIVLSGEPGLLLVLQDVTERRAAEATQRLQEGRLIQALEGADLGTWDWLVPTDEIIINHRWAEMLGYKQEDVPQTYSFWEETVHPEDMPRVQACLRAHLEGASPSYEAEHRLRHRDGHWVWVLAKGRVLERDAEGRPRRVCGTHLDVSERKRLETERASMEAQLRQAQKLEAVGQVAGGVAHDFNNLLTVQIANLGLLADLPGLPAEAHELLADIKHSAHAAAELTRRLLAFGRRQVLQPHRVDLTDVTAGFVRMLRRVLRENVRLEYQGGGRQLWLDADVGMLEQVVMNLAINAQDAMPDGGELVMETDAVEVPAHPSHPDAHPGPYVRLIVSDSGHGMDEATMCRIFEPFFTTKPLGQGSGLGLSTVYGIVRQHGGFIEVESVPGRGSSFRIAWPAASQQAVPRSEATSSQMIPCGHCESVLLVEDAFAVRRALRGMLVRLGYQVVEAADAEAAEAVWRDPGARVDLLLTDMLMPGLSGIELSSRLRRERPRFPVVLMSGYSPDLAGKELPDDVEFVQKPCDPALLATTVRRALDRGRHRGGQEAA